MQVLTTGSWPAAASTPCELPQALVQGKQAFEEFYRGKHSGRKLTWHPELGTADLFVDIQGKRHTITVRSCFDALCTNSRSCADVHLATAHMASCNSCTSNLAK